MRVNTISATAEESAAVRELLAAFFTDPPTIDPAADLTPDVLPTGGVPGMWVNGSGRTPASGVTIYVHGGGFAHSNPPMERIMAHRLSQATGRPVFAVDYRLAPAHPFPAAMDDIVETYRSLVRQGIPPTKIVLVGESAGGTLVLSTLLALAAAGDPLPAGAIPVSPVTDFTESSPSIKANRGGDVIDPSVMGGVGPAYLGGARPDQAPQSPLFGDFHGLPPILLAVGQDEVLLDDSVRFAEAAAAAGVDVTLDLYEGMTHAFHAAVLFDPTGHLPTATTFLDRIGEWVKRVA
ncbi:alpha/beta hydrolase [Allokutzneria sp. A3M-2-11 16]|uniref:alpha/beta hydrolase n=1 Tax=Allokutzneria sp. A3M-2-11 16 TaxID=2962043 RepID=UPI0020B90165|nr:alpha/beta hydrolase [Allokutzneria sp. A3M-2-11 16]MCP3802495.1 alpha/beta hydrolase [Allokutzneria sp. A3M-2-11 16]